MRITFLTSIARFSIILLFVSGALAHAAPQTLSWEQCVKQAASRNPELRAAAETLESAQAQVRSARGAFFPQLSASFDTSYGTSSAGINRSAVSTSPSLTANDDASQSYSVSLNVTHSLFSGFQDQGRVAQGAANARASEASLQLARARISYELKSAFQGLSYARDYQKVSRQIIRRREDDLRMVELRFDSGRENKGSVLLSRAYLEQARFDALQAVNAESVARAQLARILGFEERAAFAVSGEVPLQSPPAEAPDFDGLARGTPEYRQALAQAEAAEAAVTVARAPLLPSLSLTGSTARQGTTFFPTGSRWAVGVGLTVPLFSGGRDYQALLAAEHGRAAAGFTRDNADSQAVTRLEQSFAAWAEAAERLKVEESFLEAASVRAEIARSRYSNGLLSFEDWDQIENELISRQKTALQARRDRVIAEAAWEQAQGKGVIQ